MTDHTPPPSGPAEELPPVEQQRAEIAETVDALTQKLDVPARVKSTASDSVDTVRRTASQNPQLLAALGAAVAAAVVVRVVRRRRRRTRTVFAR